MKPSERLASELLATADALRTARVQVAQLVQERNAAAFGEMSARIVLQDSCRLAAALEAIAERLGTQL